MHAQSETQHLLNARQRHQGNMCAVHQQVLHHNAKSLESERVGSI